MENVKIKSEQINMGNYALTMLHGEFHEHISQCQDFSFNIRYLPKNKKIDDEFLKDYFDDSFAYRVNFRESPIFSSETLVNIHFLTQNFRRVDDVFDENDINDLLKSWIKYQNEQDIFNNFVDRFKTILCKNALLKGIGNIGESSSNKPKRKM